MRYTTELCASHIKEIKSYTEKDGSFLQIFDEIGALKNFAKFTGKHLHWSHFLINLQTFTESPSATASGTHQMYQER